MAQRTPRLNKLPKAMDPRIVEDVLRLHQMLGPKLVRVALFGSCAKKPLAEANDIDLALFMRNRSVGDVVGAVAKQQFNFAIDANSISLSYGGGGGIKRSPVAMGYDVVVLEDGAPDPDFMARNSSHLIYLTDQKPPLIRAAE